MFVSHIRHPNPWDVHWKDKPPKKLALKTHRTYTEKNERAIGNGDPALKGPVHRHSPKPSSKAPT